MAIRPATMPGDDDQWPRDTATDVEVGPLTEASWHVERRATILKFVGAVLFSLVPFVLRGGGTSHVLGLAVAVGLVIYGLRDVVAPIRLAADAEGVTVISGYAGHRRLTWAEIDRVRLDSRNRYGGRSEFLEVDAGSSLHLFSRYDLGVPPSDALHLLERVQASR